MRLFEQKPSRYPGAVLAICLIALSSCEVGSATKGKSPFRAPASKNSDVTSATSTVEVATSFNVNVTVKDKSGYGIPNVVPTVTMSKSVTGTTGVTSGGCSSTNQRGITVCSLRASLPGTYSVSVLTPVAITAAATVTVESYPRTLSFSIQPSASTVSAVVIDAQPKVLVLDKAGNPVTLPGTVTLTMSGTPTTAVLSGTTAVAAGADGFADFEFSDAARTIANNLSVNLIGTYNLTASLTHGTTGTITATSSAFTIAAGAATKLLFSVSPSASSPTDTAFSLQPVVIQADAQNNAVTTDSTCQVSLSLSGGQVSTGDQLLGSTTAMTMTAGVANFANQNLRVKRIGGPDAVLSNYQLTATASGSCNGLTAGVSSQFAITLAGLPRQLRLVQPPGTAALNESWLNQPIIGVLDVLGVPVAGDNLTSISMTKDVASPAGTLVGSTTVQVVNGTANFSALKVTGTAVGQAGTYFYDFTGINPGLTITGLDNVSQVVSANGLTPTQMRFRVQPTSVAVREEMPVIEVKTVDASGFFCFNDNASQVKLSYTPPSATDRMQQPVGFPLGVFPAADITGDQNVVNGIASFSGIAFTASGAKQITAIGGTSSPGLTAQPSDIFAINSFSSTKDHLSFTCASCLQPNDTTVASGWSQNPKVGVLDQFDNLITTDNTTVVTLTCVQTPTCTLLGTTSKRVTGGIADFSGLGVRMGTATTGVLIDATSSPLIKAQSNSFNEL